MSEIKTPYEISIWTTEEKDFTNTTTFYPESSTSDEPDFDKAYEVDLNILEQPMIKFIDGPLIEQGTKEYDGETFNHLKFKWDTLPYVSSSNRYKTENWIKMTTLNFKTWFLNCTTKDTAAAFNDTYYLGIRFPKIKVRYNLGKLNFNNDAETKEKFLRVVCGSTSSYVDYYNDRDLYVIPQQFYNVVYLNKSNKLRFNEMMLIGVPTSDTLDTVGPTKEQYIIESWEPSTNDNNDSYDSYQELFNNEISLELVDIFSIKSTAEGAVPCLAAVLEQTKGRKDNYSDNWSAPDCLYSYYGYYNAAQGFIYRDLLPQVHIITNDNTEWNTIDNWVSSRGSLGGFFAPYMVESDSITGRLPINYHYQFPLIYNYDTLYKYDETGNPFLDDLEVTSTICPQLSIPNLNTFNGITMQLQIPVGCEVEIDFGFLIRGTAKGYEQYNESILPVRSTLLSEYSSLTRIFLNGKNYNSTSFNYFDEKKFLVIGSDKMTTKNKAISPTFSQSVAGISTLTFSMYTNYFDDTTRQFIDNPFMVYLNNEARIKLKKDNEWFDFLIKSKEEDSEQNMITYTCKDYFATILGKQGYNVTLSKDLFNSQGTIKEMTDRVLEESDWRQDTSEETGTEKLIEKQEETLYEVSFPVLVGGRYGDYSGKPYNYHGAQISFDEESDTYTETCYMRYSDIVNILSKKSQDIQNIDVCGYLVRDDAVLYPEYYIILGYPNLPKDANGVVDDNEENLVSFSCNSDNLENLQENLNNRIITDYRAKKITVSYITKYVSELDKYIQVYNKTVKDEKGNEKIKEYYCYANTEYVTNDMVTELLVNGGAESEEISGITSDEGWMGASYIYHQIELSSELNEVSDENFPSAVANNSYSSTMVQSYLSFPKVSATQRTIFANLGPNSNKSILKGLVTGQRFIVELEVDWFADKPTPADYPDMEMCLRAIKYTEEGYDPIKGEDYTKVINQKCLKKSADSNSYLLLYELEIAKSINENELNDITLALATKGSTTENYWYVTKIHRASFYREIFNNNDETDYIISPNYTLRANPNNWATLTTREDYFNPTTNSPTAENRIWYNIYDPEAEENESFETEEDLTFVYRGYSSPEYQNYTAATTQEKIRELEVSKSNHFNILQSLAETFECWCKLRVDHEEDGRIKLSTSVKDHFPQEKYVSFHNFIGQKNPINLKYGINEKNIQRTIDSDSLVTKLIVEDNVNAYATNGFCTIARALDNPTKDNVIYNLDYYIQMNLLGEGTKQDLNDYQTKMGEISSSLIELTDKQSSLSTSITKEEADNEVWSNLVAESEKTLVDLKDTFNKVYNKSVSELKANISNWDKLYNDGILVDGVREDFTNILALEADISSYENLKNNSTKNLKSLKSELENINQQLSVIEEERTYLSKKFVEKYNVFLQEGTWSSNNYLDDNKYYLDARQVLAKANEPKVSYEISCIDIGALEGYEPYAYKIGDRLQIEDTEFFGWTLVYDSGKYIRTPYKEDIIVSEISFNLDDASQTSITVQNYQDQFEDLFQKISAETQSLQFKEGSYDNAASAVGSNGQILPDAITNTFNNSSFVIKNATEQGLIWDDRGLTATDQSNKNLVIRIAGGAIKISQAGEGNWTTVLTGSGINADTITTGTLNANNVKIKSGDNDAFQWNSSGLNAYFFDDNIYHKNSQITFNQYGLYGNLSSDITLSPSYEEKLQAIREASNFALTWLGFSLRTGHQNGTGYVSIDSDSDFTVNVKANPDDENYQKVIQIGHLENSSTSNSDANNETSESSEVNVIDHYGIRVKDLFGNTIFETSELGDLNGRFYIDCGSW